MSGQVADSSIKLEVSLPSGHCETISVSDSGTIADLKIAARRSFGQCFLRLATADGRLLDPTDSLSLSGLQDGDCLSAVAQQPKIAANRSAFALYCVGGHRIITWGQPDKGGDSSRVQDQLRNVQQICGSGRAFAAILADRSVVTWGDPKCGGDSSRVQDQLRNVQQIRGTALCFCCNFGRWKRGDLGRSRRRVVTAPESKISSGMSSRFVDQRTAVLLLQFWQMEAW